MNKDYILLYIRYVIKYSLQKVNYMYMSYIRIWMKLKGIILTQIRQLEELIPYESIPVKYLVKTRNRIVKKDGYQNSNGEWTQKTVRTS